MSHLVVDLGWVDLDLGSSPAFFAWSNQSQPNPAIRPDGPPCIAIRPTVSVPSLAIFLAAFPHCFTEILSSMSEKFTTKSSWEIGAFCITFQISWQCCRKRWAGSSSEFFFCTCRKCLSSHLICWWDRKLQILLHRDLNIYNIVISGSAGLRRKNMTFLPKCTIKESLSPLEPHNIVTGVQK